MEPKKYRKTAIVEAVQYTGDNFDELQKWTGGMLSWDDDHGASIVTLEGTLSLEEGAFVLKGALDECWPVREDIFKKTYEEVQEPALLIQETPSPKGRIIPCCDDEDDFEIEGLA